MPFAIGDDGLGGISDGNLACSCSRRPLFRPSFCGVRDMLIAGPDLLTAEDDSVCCWDSHDERRLRKVYFGRPPGPTPPEAGGGQQRSR